jgi:prephenate dehydratase
MPVAYLGPSGSFSHGVARQRAFGTRLVPQPTVPEVFDYVRAHADRQGVVPIENSSAGMILATVDELVRPDCPLVILEELSLNVRLALLGHSGKKIRRIFSHFAPLQHCGSWLAARFPRAEARAVASTTMAAEMAGRDASSAALAPRQAARAYGLEVLEYPVGPEIPNLTQFFVIGHPSKGRAMASARETSLIVRLKNRAGSLCHFLLPFSEQRVNLKRIVSRNIVGQPNHYFFFVGIEASANARSFRVALKAARQHCDECRVLGSYPVSPPFESAS